MIGRRNKSHQFLVASALVGSLAWHSAAFAQDAPAPAATPPAPAPTGGAILITTKSPTDKFQAEANVSYAWRFNDKIGNVFIGGPITNGIKFSVSASWHKGDGYIKDINNFAPLVPLDTTNYTFGPNA